MKRITPSRLWSRALSFHSLPDWLCCACLLAALITPARGEAIYRCTDARGGLLYQAHPCDGGQALNQADDPRNATQQRQARQTLGSHQRLADRMARERARDERKLLANRPGPIELVVRSEQGEKAEKGKPKRKKKAGTRKGRLVAAEAEADVLRQDPPLKRPKAFRALVPEQP